VRLRDQETRQLDQLAAEIAPRYRLKKHKGAAGPGQFIKKLLKKKGRENFITTKMIKSIKLIQHTPDSLEARKKEERVSCEYRGRLRQGHPDVCRWHIEKKDPECARVKCARYAEAMKSAAHN
jgi:hypothetical protein